MTSMAWTTPFRGRSRGGTPDGTADGTADGAQNADESAATPTTQSPTHHPPEAGASPAEVHAAAAAAGVDPARLPRHVAIIMDGNGRWARSRHQPRILGHRAGAKAVRGCVQESARLGLDALTLYSFSSENWKRPADEVGGLMQLLLDYLARETAEMMERGIRFRQIGRRDRLSEPVLKAIEAAEAATAGNRGLTLNIALDYGSRAEITGAIRSIVASAVAGDLDPESIDEALVSDHLDTAGLPDPDLLIRTAGEYRLSNYLLWQISYAEMHVCDACWPDFDVAQYHLALRDFAERKRRYGGLADTAGPEGAGVALP
ncbi:MAG: isoprenyl transferase [Phycisphaerales bacterium]